MPPLPFIFISVYSFFIFFMDFCYIMQMRGLSIKVCHWVRCLPIDCSDYTCLHLLVLCFCAFKWNISWFICTICLFINFSNFVRFGPPPAAPTSTVTTRWIWVCRSSRSSWTGSSSPWREAGRSPRSPDSRCPSSRSPASLWRRRRPSRARTSPPTPCPPPGCWWRLRRIPGPPPSSARRSWWWSGGRRWPLLGRRGSAPGRKVKGLGIQSSEFLRFIVPLWPCVPLYRGTRVYRSPPRRKLQLEKVPAPTSVSFHYNLGATTSESLFRLRRS